MTPESIRSFIPKISSNLDLLTLLNKVKRDLYGEKCHDFSLKVMTYYCNPARASKGYKKFKIPKKSGGFREIAAPQKSLLMIQECLNVIFQALYEPSAIATGFLPGKSVVDNASRHVGMNYVFNTDIKDFFPSIGKGRIYKMLLLKRYGFKPEIALTVAGLCCMKVVKKDPESGKRTVDYVLPQGSPASPILTNMICQNLDRRLNGLAKRFNVNCSRYADDITFSSSHNVYVKDGEFREELRRILEDQGFTMNEPKTRLQRRSERQEVTGVIVSDRVNVNRQYVRDLQSILFIWEKYGYETAFARFSRYYRLTRPNNHFGGKDFMRNVIHGKLMYMKMVKGENDPVYQRLLARLAALCPPESSNRKEAGVCELAYTIEKFEKQYETTVDFKKAGKQSKTPGKLFATSRFNGNNIYIVISKNCQEAIEKLLDGTDEAASEKIRKKFFMVMKRRKNGNPYWVIMKSNPKTAAAIKSSVKEISLDDLFAAAQETSAVEADVKVEATNQAGDKAPAKGDSTPDTQSIDAVLSQFLDSNYDLSILEKWDKTRNS